MRKLTEEARQRKWEQFLADLEHNPDPAHTWRTIKTIKLLVLGAVVVALAPFVSHVGYECAKPHGPSWGLPFRVWMACVDNAIGGCE